MTFWATCEGCGQLTPADDAWTVRGVGQCCRLLERPSFEAAALFEPGPSPMVGQAEMFNPDERQP